MIRLLYMNKNVFTHEKAYSVFFIDNTFGLWTGIRLKIEFKTL